MAARSLNRVQLIGNLTRDPELRYTPQGTAVCTVGLATNRYWTTDAGEKKEETEFHRIVSWNKLAELCAQLLTKGRKIYVEGRLSTRTWTGQDGAQRTTTEIVIDDMILLDSRRPEVVGEIPASAPAPSVVSEGEEVVSSEPASQEEAVVTSTAPSDDQTQKTSAKGGRGKKSEEKVSESSESTQGTSKGEEGQVNPDDIPF